MKNWKCKSADGKSLCAEPWEIRNEKCGNTMSAALYEGKTPIALFFQKYRYGSDDKDLIKERIVLAAAAPNMLATLKAIRDMCGGSHPMGIFADIKSICTVAIKEAESA